MRTRFTALGTAILLALGAWATVTAADTLLARRAPIFCPNPDAPYAYYQPTVDSTHAVVGWYCTATEPVVYNGSSLTATATEINKLAGVTGGTTTAAKALVVDSNKALDTLNIVTPRWGAGAGTAITLTAAEANALHSKNPVVGVGASYMVARGETALDGSNPTPVTTGLTTITGCSLTIKSTSAPGVSTSVLTYGTSSGTLNMYGWKVTATNDATLIASTGTDTIGWVCLGT